MKQFGVIFLLTTLLGHFSTAQEAYNSCNSALEICPNVPFTVNNIGANKTFCPSCEDDFNFCFSTENTIWLTFTTNAVGGNVQLDISNITFSMNPGQDQELNATLIEAAIPCNSASYTQVGNCVSNASIPISLVATLLPSTTYYVVISGDNNGAGVTSAAEATMDVVVTGQGVNRAQSQLVISPANVSMCRDDQITFTAYLSNCPDSTEFLWYINGDLVATTLEPFFSTSGLQDGDKIYASTTCYSICPISVIDSTSSISVYSFPLDAGVDQLIPYQGSTILSGATTTLDFYWEPGFYLSNTNVLNPVATPETTTTFTLTATENNCTQKDYVTISVESPLTIPNTFSPNGDGENDTWRILGIEKFPDCQLEIFDRWGQSIYQATGYGNEKAWDGTVRSGKVNEGVYFYVLDLRDPENQRLKGSVTLIR